MAEMDAAAEEVVEERPGRRREWTGPWRSVVLPVLVVAVIATAIFHFETGGHGSTEAGRGLGLVPLPAEKNSSGVRPEARLGKLAPDFVLPTVDGSKLRLSDLRDHPVVINFWATWCGPCRQEMPEIESIAERMRDAGLVIVAVNVQEGRDKIKAWTDEYGLTFPVVLDTSGAVTREYLAIGGLPSTFFVGRDGAIRSIHRGQMDRRAMLDYLAEILAGRPAAPSPAAVPMHPYAMVIDADRPHP